VAQLDQRGPRWSRRTALGIATSLVLATLSPRPPQAAAGRGWCRSDPVVLLDGVPADIFSSAPLTALLEVTGPTQIIVTAPQGVAAQLLIAGVGFGRGERVTFAHSPHLQRTATGIEVTVAVFVPARADFAVTIDFSPRLIDVLTPMSAAGQANDWIRLDAQQPPLLALTHGHRHHRHPARRSSSPRDA
jgi:hypothetical protein